MRIGLKTRIALVLAVSLPVLACATTVVANSSALAPAGNTANVMVQINQNLKAINQALTSFKSQSLGYSKNVSGIMTNVFGPAPKTTSSQIKPATYQVSGASTSTMGPQEKEVFSLMSSGSFGRGALFYSDLVTKIFCPNNPSNACQDTYGLAAQLTNYADTPLSSDGYEKYIRDILGEHSPGKKNLDPINYVASLHAAQSLSAQILGHIASENQVPSETGSSKSYQTVYGTALNSLSRLYNSETIKKLSFENNQVKLLRLIARTQVNLTFTQRVLMQQVQIRNTIGAVAIAQRANLQKQLHTIIQQNKKLIELQSENLENTDKGGK